MNDMTIIIPLHKFDTDIEWLLMKALMSIKSHTKTIISCHKDIYDTLVKNYSKRDNMTIISCNDSDFCSLVNNAVSHIDTDWFSVLEYDDTYNTDIWFKNMEMYLYSNKDAKVYLPLVDLFDYEKMNNTDNPSSYYCGYANEAAWASSFSNELGFIDNDCLQTFFNFNMTGTAIHTDTFKKVGMLKPNVFMTFWYEFMLRLTKQGHKMYVIPFVGYNHYVNRKGSLSVTCNEKLESADEGEYWIKVAKEECTHIKMRPIKPYEKKEN